MNDETYLGDGVMSELRICPHCGRAVEVIAGGFLSTHSMRRRKHQDCPMSGHTVDDPIANHDDSREYTRTNHR